MAEHPQRYPTPSSSPDNEYRQMKGAKFNLPMRPMVSPQTTSPSTSTSTLSTPSSSSPPAKKVRFSESPKTDAEVRDSLKSFVTHTLPMRPRTSAPSRDNPSAQHQKPNIPPKCPEVPGQTRHERQLKKDSKRTKRFEPSTMQKRLESDKHHSKKRQSCRRGPRYVDDPDRDPDEVDEAFFLQKMDGDIKGHYEEKRLAAMAHMAESAERRQRPGVRVDDALRTRGSYERLRP